MERNELMIGDWVYRPDCYDKVKEIRENGIIGCDHLRGIISFEELEPIPLTTEILEKNGFECKHKGEALKRLYWILYVDGGSVKVKVNRGLFLFNICGVPFQFGFYVPSVNKHIQYVHELQHALRLCGIEKEIIL